ncbi:MAG: glycosyltransferase family 4 protein, partial [Phycisphaeraceae bacterium]|nr:glycosyltransferase family 4 protein [Phycisphaeraceae bacterium]
MAQPSRPPTLLIISQVYVPDPAAVGQHMHSAAAEMVRRGWRVIVFASRRGYDDPAAKYLWRQTLDGVEVRRFPFASFGKASIAVRLLAGFIFIAQCAMAGLFVRRLSAILVSTSPPMAPLGAVLLSLLRRAPIKYWAMDLNPDQMIALGKLSPTSLPARLFDAMNRLILRRAADVVPLDRFMAERLYAKLPGEQPTLRAKTHVIPPWPHDDHLEIIPHDHNPFRAEHHLAGKFVIMYSGNHTTSNPLATILQAALRLQHRRDLVFMFVGGGLGKREVQLVIDQHHPTNILSLPYQPIDRIKYSLSAADVHLVSVGPAIVGICHPCKVYGAMALAKPILLLGPDPSHVSDLIHQRNIGWHIPHGDVDAAVRTIEAILAADPAERAAMGQRAAALIHQQLSMRILIARFADVLERGVIKPAAPARGVES